MEKLWELTKPLKNYEKRVELINKLPLPFKLEINYKEPKSKYYKPYKAGKWHYNKKLKTLVFRQTTTKNGKRTVIEIIVKPNKELLNCLKKLEETLYLKELIENIKVK